MFFQKKVILVVLCFVQIIFAQDPILGVVQDAETGAPIIGVNILLIGTETGTVTDVDGSFTLEKPVDIQPILRLSHIGYNTIERPLVRVCGWGRISVSRKQVRTFF